MSSQNKSSTVSGFYKLPVEKRLEFVKDFANLESEEIKLFSSCLDIGIADRMIGHQAR